MACHALTPWPCCHSKDCWQARIKAPWSSATLGGGDGAWIYKVIPLWWIGWLQWFTSFGLGKLQQTKNSQNFFVSHPSCLTRKAVETLLSTMLWHISRTNKGSNVKCSTIRAVTHEKCKSVIVDDTPALCYEGPFKLPSFKELKSKRLVFCKWYWDVCNGFDAWLCFQANNLICSVNEKMNQFDKYRDVHAEQ